MAFDPPHIEHFEEITDVRHGFVEDLLAEDDWSFVIKLHAFIEAASTQLLVRYFQEPDLTDFLSRLSQNRRIKLLSSVGYLGKTSRRYMTSLSGLRNRLVHNVANVNFSFSELTQGMSEEERRNFARDFIHYWAMRPHESGRIQDGFVTDEDAIQKARDEPKFYVWRGAVSLLNSQYDMESYGEFRQSEKAQELYQDDD